jgi:hypothetical protein
VGRGALSRILACALLAGAVTAAAALAGIGPNPANHRSLIDEPIESYRYDRATRCRDATPKGTRALIRWLKRRTSGSLWTVHRCERLPSGDHSLHAEGRAVDWAMDARKRAQKRQAMRLIRKRLLAPDRRGNENALARRMGVQGIIFNCRSWFSRPGGLGPYGYCYKPNGKRRRNLNPTAAHIDHIHFELSKPGARKRTSFWRSKASRR